MYKSIIGAVPHLFLDLMQITAYQLYCDKIGSFEDDRNDTHNYFIAAFVGGVLTMYLVIFTTFLVKYSQYMSNRKYDKIGSFEDDRNIRRS